MWIVGLGGELESKGFKEFVEAVNAHFRGGNSRRYIAESLE